MPWVRIDDHYDQHPKIAQVGPLGVALWLAGLAYCNRTLTDGFIPWSVAHTLVSWQYLNPPDAEGKRVIVTACVTAGFQGDDVTSEYVIKLLTHSGLWEEVSGGFMVHDYPDFQRLKKDVLREREASVTRQLRHRSQPKSQRDNVVSNGSVTPAPVPVPSSTPLPPPSVKRTSKSKSKTSDQDPDGFSSFWLIYPRHVARQAALKSWRTISPSAELQTRILAALTSQLPTFACREPEKIPHASTWLNGKRWEDEAGSNGNGNGRSETEDPYAEFPVAWQCSDCGEVHEVANDRVPKVCPLRTLIEGVNHGQSPEA